MSNRRLEPRARPSASAVDTAHAVRRWNRVNAYAFALLAFALCALVALLAFGAPLPSPGLCLLLAIPLAVCMNRFVVFTNEVGATAEAAVLFAALVVFRDDAVTLGPLFLALLVGPLDARHWERRSFARMAFNSGSQGATTLAAVAVFTTSLEILGSSPAAVATGLAAATVPYVLVETLLGVVLTSLWGEAARDALRQQLPINCLALPLALYGVAAGLVGSSIGWWFTLGVLVPVPLVPELVLVRARRRSRDVGAVTLLAVGVVVIGAAVLLTTVPVRDPLALAGLLVCALLLGAEVRAVSATAVPPVIGLLVAAALLAGGGAGVLLTVPAVVAVATGSSWWRAGSTARAWRGAALAGCLAVAVAQAWRMWPGDRNGGAGPAAWLGVVVAAAAFEVAAVLLSRQRRDELTRVLWIAPLLATIGVLAIAAHAIDGPGGIAVFAVGTASSLAVVAAAGAPPWRSRVLGPRLSRVPRRAVRWAMVALCALAVVTAGAAATMEPESSRRLWLAFVALAELLVTIALVRTRQWRFAPRTRMHAVAWSSAAALAILALASAVGVLRA